MGRGQETMWSRHSAYSRAGNPSAARTASFRRSWAGPPRKRVGETATNFKSTLPKIAEKPLCARHFYAVRSDSDEGGHRFQFDRGHHSNLMAARLASSRRPILLMS